MTTTHRSYLPNAVKVIEALEAEGWRTKGQTVGTFDRITRPMVDGAMVSAQQFLTKQGLQPSLIIVTSRMVKPNEVMLMWVAAMAPDSPKGAPDG